MDNQDIFMMILDYDLVLGLDQNLQTTVYHHLWMLLTYSVPNGIRNGIQPINQSLDICQQADGGSFRNLLT